MVDVVTAEHHGVCPTCEGCGGRADDEACETDSNCAGSCPNCWCRGCRDGYGVKWDEEVDEHPCGSWEAYLAAQTAASDEERKA